MQKQGYRGMANVDKIGWNPCCRTFSWTNISSSNKIQRNYKGLKITACMYKIMSNKIQKDQKLNCRF